MEQVVTALASARDFFSNFDYALVDNALLTTLDLKIEQTVGHTPDQEANACWHRDLVELSEPKLMALIRAIAEKGEIARIPEKKMTQLIQRAVNVGRLDRTKLKKGLAAKLKV
ncbi:MAG: hypothetical protein HOP18_08760 [Deltaproteobacteria bacterium]|nr:hypothetical protein [Deltaproteobacteria bacterium]